MSREDTLMALAVFALALAFSALVFSTYFSNAIDPEGVSWDFLAHYTSARALLASHFTPSQVELHLIEAQRAPLGVALLAFCLLFGSRIAIPLSIAILLALFFRSLLFLSRKFSISPLILFAVIAVPYLANFSVLYNIEDILSLSLVLFTLGLLKERSVLAGGSLAVAGLSKYSSLLFLPLLLLLETNEKRAKAYLLFIMVTAPWLVLSTLAWGNPLSSYSIAVSAEASTAQPYQIYLAGVPVVFGSLLVPLAVLVLLLFLAWKNAKPAGSRLKDLRGFAATLVRVGVGYPLLLFLLLSVLGWLAVAPSQSYFNQERYASLVFLGVALVIASAISKCVSDLKLKMPPFAGLQLRSLLPCILFLFSFVLLIDSYAALRSAVATSVVNNQPFWPALQEIRNLGLENCSIVSNSWIYLDFYNVTAHSPYYSNSEIARYPMVVFNTTSGFASIGAPPAAVGVDGSSRIFSSPSFSIYLPANYTCARGILGTRSS